jgi:PKHD-type hydroxylase
LRGQNVAPEFRVVSVPLDGDAGELIAAASPISGIGKGCGELEPLVYPPGRGGLSGQERLTAIAIAEGVSAKARPGTVYSADLRSRGVDPDVRRAHVARIELTDETRWLFSRVRSVADSANSLASWRFDLVGPARSIQASWYADSDRGMFDWHRDAEPWSPHMRVAGNVRKIAVVIELQPAEEGGVLEFKLGNVRRSAASQPGSATVFPTFLPHRVTPVTRGCRLSLTSWIVGPQFR